MTPAGQQTSDHSFYIGPFFFLLLTGPETSDAATVVHQGHVQTDILKQGIQIDAATVF